MRLIVGLGNPGVRFKYSRHNVGFMVVDNLVRVLNIRFRKNIYLKANVSKKEEILLAKPYTFMNLSGFSVRRMVDKFHLGLENILVVCDELNLPLGKIRLRKKGSSGGHKGLDSVIQVLETQDFPRLRIGIGKPQQDIDIDVSSFVLSKFSKQEFLIIEEAISKASQCILDWMKVSIEEVMAKYN